MHGHNGWPGREPEPLQRQIEQLTDLLNQTKCPVVLTGDFNTFTVERTNVILDFVKKQRFSSVINSAVYNPKKNVVLDYVFSRDVTIE